MYDRIIRPILFSLQPENAHDVMRHIGACANSRVVSRLLSANFAVKDARLKVDVAGLSFDNPIGLAAGFDKNVELVGLWTGLGFGHIELGTVTAKPQPGNPRPRIFRLEGDRALINRMGFPSEGADLIEKRLDSLRERSVNFPILGINIGKSKITEIDHAIDDYCYSFQRLARYVDYIAVNVSSPNTPGLRQLQERDRLLKLLTSLQGYNIKNKPLFVKVAPDLTFEALEEIVDVCLEARISGLIATNTTTSREGIVTVTSEAGGLSGMPIFKRSLEVVEFLASCIKGRMALIGVGGISNHHDVLAMLSAGANLIQVYTGLIYNGPGFVKSLNSGLISFMNDNKCLSLQEASTCWREMAQVGRVGRTAV